MINWITADVFDGLAQLDDGSVDLVVTSPPFLALRSYLPADHPDKGREIGGEGSPAEFVDTLLRLSGELRRVLAPHGSIAVELGDTYAGSGGAGGDYNENGLREGQSKFSGSARRAGEWPEAKSRTLIPEAYRLALAYGLNPLTGEPSPAGRWRVRNVVTWVRPNPPVGALGDKWRPATSDLVVACTSPKRYWDDIATRRESQGQPDFESNGPKAREREALGIDGTGRYAKRIDSNVAGAPLLDWWEIPPGGYDGAHYAVFPAALVVPCVQAMLPPKVCLTCGEPSRRIIHHDRKFSDIKDSAGVSAANASLNPKRGPMGATYEVTRESVGWSDCGHDNWRPPHILDPFAGSGTTGLVATGHQPDATVTLIDLDERNRRLAEDRIGPLLFAL